jgi:endonuclease V-like protein UPF0215 family
MKPEARIIAWDDFAFEFKDEKVSIVGVIFRGGKMMDGMLSCEIEKDGTDVTAKMANAIATSRHFDQLSYIMLDGITFGGFNTIDIKALNSMTGIPVIVVMRKKPDVPGFIKAMGGLDKYEKRLIAVNNAGNIYTYGDIFYQKAGIGNEEAEDILKSTATNSNIPEPLRAAHIIASGMSRKKGEFFESKGRP